MQSKRPINVLEAEPSPSQSLSSLSFRVHIDPCSDLLSTAQTGLQVQALDYESKGQFIKAAKYMLRCLLLAQRLEAQPETEWKRIGAEVFTVIEGNAVEMIKNGKPKGAGRLIKAMDKWLENGGGLKDRRWHQVRVLQL